MNITLTPVAASISKNTPWCLLQVEDEFLPASKPVEPAMVIPHRIETDQSDRFAVYDEKTKAYHLFSYLENVSRPGFTQYEATEWVEGRLVLTGRGLSLGRLCAVGLMVATSWACMIALVYSAIKFLL